MTPGSGSGRPLLAHTLGIRRFIMKLLARSAGPFRTPVLLLGALLLVASCGGDPAGPPVPPIEPDPPANMGAYLGTLPSWEVFSPPLEDKDPEPVGPAVELAPITLDVEKIDAEGNTNTYPNMTYLCTETEYSMTKNPREIVMYSPKVGVLWAGGLLQGKSHKAGNLESLPIRQRQPIKVSIPDIASGQNFRVVENPDLATVNAAIMDIIGTATLAGTPSSSSIDFKLAVTHSESQLALAMGLSGRYMGFKGKASADFTRNASETTVTAHFVERMFDVVVELPQTPAGFFSSAFTQKELDQQIALGRIGPDNLPIFVHTITYGRMMTFSMTSTATATEINAAISAAYKDLGRKVKVELTAKHLAILENSRVAVTSYGGNAQATLDVIRTGDWSQYFTEAAPLATAAPLSYLFQNLDGKPAGVTEATNYKIRDCKPQSSQDGIFDLAELQVVSLGIPTTGLRTLTADVNGDGRTDIIWNSVTSSGNSWVVGLSNGDGTFTMTAPVTHPVANPTAGWVVYGTVVGDFDGDGLPDLAWATRGTGGTLIYLAISKGDGTFVIRNVFTGGGSGAAHSAWHVYAGDANGNRRTDLFFNHRTSSDNRNITVIATSNQDGTFTVGSNQEHPVKGSWHNYGVLVGDLNGDGRDDLTWTLDRSGSPVRIFVAFTGSTGRTLAFRDAFEGYWSFEQNSVYLVGDVNGDGRANVVLAKGRPPATADSLYNQVLVIRASPEPIRFISNGFANIRNRSPATIRLGDLNGDGRADLLWSELGTDNQNRMYVSLAKADGAFDFSTSSQVHPVERPDWAQYEPYLADVNGNGRHDVVWIHPGVQTRIYVGLAVR
jgi:hypothetical protein